MPSLPRRNLLWSVPLTCLGTARADEPYHVGAWYFLRWSSAAPSDAWANLRQSNRRPLIGFYDLAQQSVVDAEIRQAANVGIEFLAFYWYLHPETGQVFPTAAGVTKFFESSVRTMKYVLAPIVPENMRARAITAEVWEARIVPQIVKYMRSDAYYRSNGSPMIVDFWLPLQDRKTAYAVLRREVLSSIGVNPTIILLVGGRPAYRDLFFQSVTGPNGFTCFNMGTTKPDEPYAALVAEWAQMMKTQIAAPGKPPDRSLTFLPCGTLGIDARPWGVPESRPFVTGSSPDLFRRHLEEIKAFIDSNQVNTLRTTILYAWNEWGEAAHCIEPSETEGYRYADVVRDVFALSAKGSRP